MWHLRGTVQQGLRAGTVKQVSELVERLGGFGGICWVSVRALCASPEMDRPADSERPAILWHIERPICLHLAE